MVPWCHFPVVTGSQIQTGKFLVLELELPVEKKSEIVAELAPVAFHSLTFSLLLLFSVQGTGAL